MVKRCGFVAVIGAPNSGKSTLVNQLVGTKISIISPKVQTTRNRILGITIVKDKQAQVIFIDTPGIFIPKHRFDRAMVNATWNGVYSADLIALMIDVKFGLDSNSQLIIDRLKKNDLRATLVLNKIDLVKRSSLLDLTTIINEIGIFDRVFMINARAGDGTKDLLDFFAQNLPEEQWHFPEEQISDVPMRQFASEITREQVLHQLHQEIPYAIMIKTEHWMENNDGSVRINQIIYIQKNNQKAIILGKAGRKIRSIGNKARIELEELLERRVHLFLYVKVRNDWSNDRQYYKELGLDFEA
ncbi:MAG: GTPase Era [Rhodospirillaceae bacterium]|nr:GTPase Era [Rhodospirillaceae bacterium]